MFIKKPKKSSSHPLGKIRRIHFNVNNQKVIDDPEFGTVDYEGWSEGRLPKLFKVINTVQNENPNVDLSPSRWYHPDSAVPHGGRHCYHSVYLDLDISQSKITAKEDTKIGDLMLEKIVASSQVQSILLSILPNNIPDLFHAKDFLPRRELTRFAPKIKIPEILIFTRNH